MSLDLSKLSPAPWTALVDPVLGMGVDLNEQFGPFFLGGDKWPLSRQIAFADFVVLSRNAFDVMLRRGWVVSYSDEQPRKWHSGIPMSDMARIADAKLGHDCPLFKDGFDDPFTAIVEADKWFKEHVEKVTS